MDKKLKVGVVGCGQIAQIAHLPYLQELPQFEIGALADLSPQVLDSLGKKYGVSHLYTKYEEMLQAVDLDAVLIANKNHAAPAIAALESGKHVLVEKPIAFNLKQADAMISTAKRNNVKLMVAYMKRYDPAFEIAKEIVSQMDSIHMIRVHDFAGTYKINSLIYELHTATDLPAEGLRKLQQEDQADILVDIGKDRHDLFEAHDIMIHLAIHDINALHGLYGLPQKVISAQLFRRNFVTALLEYENGVRLMWETGNLTSLVEWDEEIKVWGKDQRITIKYPFPYLKNAATKLMIEENNGDSAVKREVTPSYDEAFKREWRHFYNCIIEDKQPLTNAVEAREDLAFAVKLMKAAIT
jgi:predicted dehydrogenase